jgi:hypothetical protein
MDIRSLGAEKFGMAYVNIISIARFLKKLTYQLDPDMFSSVLIFQVTSHFIIKIVLTVDSCSGFLAYDTVTCLVTVDGVWIGRGFDSRRGRWIF